MNVPLFEAIADLLIPAGADMPSATEAYVGTTGLSEVLKFRPELEAAIENILERCHGKSPQQALDSLDSAAFGTVAEVVASAYFMNDEVRRRLQYSGQRARTIVPEEIDRALLERVVDRGPIYREAK